MKTKDVRGKLNDILLKLAQGFSYKETTEEYVPTKASGQIGMQDLATGGADNNVGLTLAKRKISCHYVPPDMLAIKLLLQADEQKMDTLSSMTDEELLELKNKLVRELTEEDK